MTRALPTETDKLRSQRAACAIHAAGDSCLACDAIRDRLRLLEAPALDLDALPVTVPPEHQALSSGRLATPERNHGCPDCGGLGEVSIYPCQVCGGTGELTAAGARTEGALSQSLPPRADKAIRSRLSSARDAGLLGAVGKRGAR